jgi:hypothetical protein
VGFRAISPCASHKKAPRFLLQPFHCPEFSLTELAEIPQIARPPATHGDGARASNLAGGLPMFRLTSVNDARPSDLPPDRHRADQCRLLIQIDLVAAIPV